MRVAFLRQADATSAVFTFRPSGGFTFAYAIAQDNSGNPIITNITAAGPFTIAGLSNRTYTVVICTDAGVSNLCIYKHEGALPEKTFSVHYRTNTNENWRGGEHNCAVTRQRIFPNERARWLQIKLSGDAPGERLIFRQMQLELRMQGMNESAKE